MAFVGLAVTFAGFLIAAASVGITAGTSGRLVLVLAGLAISLFGIIGMINPAYTKTAIWKR
jgi:hypothetical protein